MKNGPANATAHKSKLRNDSGRRAWKATYELRVEAIGRKNKLSLGQKVGSMKYFMVWTESILILRYSFHKVKHEIVV